MAQRHFGDTTVITPDEAMERLGEALGIAEQYAESLVPDISDHIATHDDVQKLFDKFVLGK